MRLGAWHRWIVLATLAAVAASGLLWFVLHDVMGRPPGDLLRALLVVHGVTSFASAIAFGSLLPWHVLGGYLWRRNLLSGMAVTLTMVVLIASALLLYSGGEQTREWARLVHLAAGFALVAVIVLHVILGRRLRLASPASS
jgi:hypothetical protein